MKNTKKILTIGKDIQSTDINLRKKICFLPPISHDDEYNLALSKILSSLNPEFTYNLELCFLLWFVISWYKLTRNFDRNCNEGLKYEFLLISIQNVINKLNKKRILFF